VSTLADLQADLRAALLGGPDGPAAAAVREDGLAAGARLAIYRHHVFATLRDALTATYPVVCRLVDERFFAYAADRYLRHHPPAGPCLFEYGARFAEFLARFPPCRHLAYLPDVARLEWALNVARHAGDVVPLDSRPLQELEGSDAPRLRFTFDPSLALLASPWPIDRIWRANQPDAGDATVDLAAGRARLEVRRSGDEVGFRSLDPAPWAFRASLRAGRPLETAAAAALALDPGFDLAEALHALLVEGVLTAFTLAPEARHQADDRDDDG
jgi:hypothetical protein